MTINKGNSFLLDGLGNAPKKVLSCQREFIQKDLLERIAQKCLEDMARRKIS